MDSEISHAAHYSRYLCRNQDNNSVLLLQADSLLRYAGLGLYYTIFSFPSFPKETMKGITRRDC